MRDAAENPEQKSSGKPRPNALIQLVKMLGRLSVASLFIGLAIAGAMALQMRAAAEPPHLIAPPVGVTTMKVVLVDSYQRVASYTGRIEANRETRVAFERAGLVTAIKFDEGDAVRAGDVIATLDTDRLQASRGRLLARQKQLEARLKLADLTLGRQAKLETRGWSPKQRLDEAEANRAELTAAVAEVKAEIAVLDVDLEQSVLRAPFDGQIASRLVDEGAVVAAGTNVAQLFETNARRARIGLPPQRASRLSENKTYTLYAGDTAIAARLVAIRDDLQTSTRTVTTLFELETTSQNVALGELVRLEIDVDVTERGAWVPLAALKEGRRGLWTILTVERSSDEASVVRPELVEVLYARGDDVFVRGTFRDGAEILTNGTDRVVAGQRVALKAE